MDMEYSFLNRLDAASLAWVSFIEAELKRGLPDGYTWECGTWEIQPLPEHLSDLLWSIFPPKDALPGGCYNLYTSRDGHTLILTYDNTDLGGGPQLWDRAFVVDVEELEGRRSLAWMVNRMVTSCGPNRYGLT